jgi:hypothetical protein
MSGICSQQNLKSRQTLYHVWENAIRKGRPERKDKLSQPILPSLRNLYVKEITTGDSKACQRYVLVYSPKEAERQDKSEKNCWRH